MPLLACVEGKDLTLLPVVPWHVREHAEQMAAGGLGDKRRMIQGMEQLPQAGHPETAVPGKKRLGRSLVCCLPRTDPHRTNIIASGEGPALRLAGAPDFAATE